MIYNRGLNRGLFKQLYEFLENNKEGIKILIKIENDYQKTKETLYKIESIMKDYKEE
jgi:hypothetical protein